GAGAGTAGALLLPGLGATATHLGAGLGALGARTAGGELGGDDLVHHRDVRLDAEDVLIEVDRAGVGAGRGLDGHRRHHAPPLVAALTASRITTSPPLGPGTAPRTSRRFFSASEETTRRLRVVTFSAPMRPAIRVPLNTRAGVAQAP